MFEKAVRPADRQLALDAAKVMNSYFHGEIDPYTGKQISYTTFKWAFGVFSLFSQIDMVKGLYSDPKVETPTGYENVSPSNIPIN